MMIVMVELMLAGLAVVGVVAIVIRYALTRRRRHFRRNAISEAEARANAAPLTAAIIGPDRHERTRRGRPSHKRACDGATTGAGPAERAARAERDMPRRI